MTARFDAIGLVVADMGRALAFYRTLGLDVPADADDQPHVDVPLPNGSRLMFDTIETVRGFIPTGPRRQAARGGPRGPPATARVTSTRSSPSSSPPVTQAIEPWDVFWGQRYASVRDPDGNGVDLFAASCRRRRDQPADVRVTTAGRPGGSRPHGVRDLARHDLDDDREPAEQTNRRPRRRHDRHPRAHAGRVGLGAHDAARARRRGPRRSTSPGSDDDLALAVRHFLARNREHP